MGGFMSLAPSWRQRAVRRTVLSTVLIALTVAATLHTVPAAEASTGAPMAAAGATAGSMNRAADSSAGLPPGFVSEDVATGLSQPVSMAFLPDGRILIVEKTGGIRIGDPSTVPMTTAPYLTLANINSGAERGLLDIALDPDFATNGHLYVYYTPGSPERARISRFTHIEHQGGTTSRADLSSEVGPLWEDTAGYTSCCHFGGGLDFGPDGKLWLTTGDKFIGSRAQDLSDASGKIIRINADGSIPDGSDGWPANPFVDGPGGNVDAIWAYGLRNPFRARWDLPTNRLFIGEVGGNNQLTAWEDVHLARAETAYAGVDYGWPNCEGLPPYTHFPTCTIGGTLGQPIFAYPHAGSGASVTGGVVYRGFQFPSVFHGAYFYADYVQGFVRYLTFDESGTTVTASHAFDTAAQGLPVAVEQGTDGYLYYADITGKIRRYVYADGNHAPIVTMATADPTATQVDTEVMFTGAAHDDEGDPITYTWFFGDGSSAPGPNATHQYADEGLYEAYLRVDDPTRFALSQTIPIQVGNPPAATIETPTGEQRFRGGDTISFAGSAVDGNGDPVTDPSAFRWTVQFTHNEHTHPVLGPVTGTSGSFEIPSSGHDYTDDTGYRIRLEVTLPNGLRDIEIVEVAPDKSDITFATSPAGLTMRIDSLPYTPPVVFDTMIDFEHAIEAVSPQCVDGTLYQFTNWSHGATRSHVYTVPDHDQTVTANYADIGTCVSPVTDGLVLHLESDRDLLSNPSGVVTQWVDQSHSANHVTSWGDPSIGETTTPSGFPAVSFDGVGDRLERTAALNGLPAGNTDRSMFVVANYRGASSWAGTAYGNGAPNQAFGLTVRPGFGQLALQAWGAGNDLVSGTAGIGAGWLTQSAVLSDGVATMYKNGEAIGTKTHAYDTAVSRLVIGQEISNLGFLVGDVAAVLIYDRALSPSERSDVEEYLAAKFLSPIGPPAAPAGVTASHGDTRVNLSWDANTESDLAGYNLYRSESTPVDTSAAPLNGATLLTTTSYVDTAVTNDVTYHYVVTAVDTAGNESDPATEVSATPAPLPPSACPAPLADSTVLCLESTTGITETGGLVTQWIDQSNSFNHVSAWGDPRVGEETTPSDAPAITLDGVGDKLERTAMLNGLPQGNSDRSMFVVANYHGASAWAGTAYGSPATNQAFGLTVRPNFGQLSLQAWGANNDLVSTASGIGAGWITQSAVLSDGTATLYKNGASVGTKTHTYNTGATRLVVGQEISNLGYVDADVAAVLVYDRALSVAERQQVETYLQAKYLTPPGPPVAPVGLTAAGGDGSVDLTWDANPEADVIGYHVYRSESTPVSTTGEPLNGATPVADASFVDTTVANGTTYHYVVTAVDMEDHESPASAEATATPAVIPPPACAAPLSDDTVLCLEADLGVATSGATVTGWSDESSARNHLIAAGDPTIGEVTTPSGAPAVSFDGNGDKVERTSAVTGLPTGDADRSVFVIARYSSVGYGGVSYGNPGPCNQTFGLIVRSNGNLTLQGWCNDFVTSVKGTGAGWLSQSVVLDGNQFTHYKNGTAIGSGSHTFNTVANRIVIGAEIDSAPYIDVDVAAVLVYDRALDASERSAVEAYLHAKYLDAPPAAPANLVAQAGDAEVGLSWSAVSEPDVTGYDVYRSETAPVDVTGVPVNEHPVTGTAFVDSTATNGVTYHYAVVAIDAAGHRSGPSGEASATPQAPLPPSCDAPFAEDAVVCLRADVGVTLSGGLVTGWADQSAAGNHLVGAGDPTLDAATPSGAPAIRFDGSGDRLDRTSGLTGLPAGNADRSMFVVGNYRSASAWGGTAYGTAANNQAFGLTLRPSGGRLVLQGWGGTNDLVSSAPGFGSWLTHAAVLSNGTATLYKDGALIGTKNQTYATAVSRLVIGQEIGNAGYINGDVAAVLIYDRALSAAERQQVEAYLSARYFVPDGQLGGLTGAPAVATRTATSVGRAAPAPVAAPEAPTGEGRADLGGSATGTLDPYFCGLGDGTTAFDTGSPHPDAPATAAGWDAGPGSPAGIG